jgi:SRSO17 transposase
MDFVFDAAGQIRLEQYFSAIGEALTNKKRRESFAVYAMGLLGNAARKSAEPLAAAASGDPTRCSAAHQRLVHFMADSPWSDREVRRVATKHAVDALTAQEPVRTWIVDDTGFLKQGKHSVGVQRQYTGSAGKIANCQIGVSLSIATRSAHVPIDFELYLPEDWANDATRRTACKVPSDVVFKSKEDLALDMIERAVHDGVPGDILLADSWYGRSAEFRGVLTMYGFQYALGIMPQQRMMLVDKLGKPLGDVTEARAIASALGKGAFRRVTWREGSMPGPRGKLSSRFALRRVLVEGSKQPEWLLIEQMDNDNYKCALTTLPSTMSKKQIVRLFKERYRTERVYEEMKNELGLDHFEGRSFVGWHHHVTVALCCYAFVIAERTRHFPPSLGRRGHAPTNSIAA